MGEGKIIKTEHRHLRTSRPAAVTGSYRRTLSKGGPCCDVGFTKTL